MSESNRSIRVRAEVGKEASVNVNINQDIDVLEILSLKINATNMYKLHQSNYGVLAGRVLANNSVGVPNAKVSVFIKADEEWINDSIFNELYPFYDVKVKNSDNKRYNLLPEYSVSDCYTPVGTFPSKRMVLDDDNIIEVYDRFYKYTTKTNQAGDYMIFGVPTGTQQIHTDVDLSDIGFLSQKPRDFIANGYNANQFENANKFKNSTNLDYLPQIITSDDSVHIYPLWGEEGDGLGDIKITRKDIYLDYEFKTYCVFMGSIIVDDNSNGVSRKCIPTERMGKMDKLTTGSGTIEMIRKKPDGNVEEFQISGTQLIDEDGTWCYQIPMNLDYVKSDEYGNLVPTDDPDNGIPTRTRVRFRVSLNDFESDSGENHLAKVLVPNNPNNDDLKDENGSINTGYEPDYSFGSDAKDDEYATKSFRDLFWNNVYSVKQFIPRIQKGNVQWNKKFTGIKGTNINGSNNSIPYNNMRVHLTFMFILQCAIFKSLIWIITIVNKIFGVNIIAKHIDNVKCIYLGDGICQDLDEWYFAPGCRATGHRHKPDAWKNAWTYINEDTKSDTGSIDTKNKEDNETVCLTNNKQYLVQCVEISLAQEYEVIKFDFYNDWLNGMLYIPRWFAKYRKKKNRLIGNGVRKEAALLACKTENSLRRRLTQQCALEYQYDVSTNSITNVTSKVGCKSDSKLKCHRAKGRKHITALMSGDGIGQGGLLKIRDTLSGKKVYYFKPCEWFKRGSEYIKINMFATDIVLLGSLNDCDKHGIPQAFRYLKSSSYFMPSNLASTNMDENGNMYMIGGTSICSGSGKKTTDGLSPATAITFDEFNKWSKNKDFYETPPTDVTEYAVTETAGIDWGFTGPNQQKASSSDDLLYNPGGHFLGISCVRPEVSIKSCLNLSRICEIGVGPSSRHYVATKNGDNIRYTYIYPNGLISKDEIDDTDIRSMFATMNQNGLRTKYDSTTNYLKYDFISMRPNNFNGEFKNIVDSDINYNNIKFRLDDQAGTVDSETSAYTRSNEWTSKDYYNFRLGLNGTEKLSEQGNHFLKKDGDTYSMPRYENSFYFYFGLKDGNTALDRFFNDFYAPCQTMDEDYNMFKISPSLASYCNQDNGTLSVQFNNVDGPYKVKIIRKDNETVYYFYEEAGYDGTTSDIIMTTVKYYKHYTEDGYYYNTSEERDTEKDISDPVLSDFYESVSTSFKISNIHGSEKSNESTYTVTLSTYDGTSKEIDFYVGIDTSSLKSSINGEVTDFTNEEKDDSVTVWNKLKSNEFDVSDGNGYINFKLTEISNQELNGYFIGIILANSDYYAGFTKKDYISNENLKQAVSDTFSNTWLDYSKDDSKFNSIDSVLINDSEFNFPVWKGNDDYTAYMIVTCDYQNFQFLNVSTYTVSMPLYLNMYFYDNDALYTDIVEPIIGKCLMTSKNSEAYSFTSVIERNDDALVGVKDTYDYIAISAPQVTRDNWWEALFDCYYCSNDWKEWDETAYLCRHTYLVKISEPKTYRMPEDTKVWYPMTDEEKETGIFDYDNVEDGRIIFYGEHIDSGATTCSENTYRVYNCNYFSGSTGVIGSYYYKFYKYDDIGGRDYIMSITPKQMWSIKKALFFTNSVYKFTSSNSIKVGLTGGTPPYTEYLAGTPERGGVTFESDDTKADFVFTDVLSGRTVYAKSASISSTFKNDMGISPLILDNSGYEISKDNFYLPTFGLVIHDVVENYSADTFNYDDMGFLINGVASIGNGEDVTSEFNDSINGKWIWLDGINPGCKVVNRIRNKSFKHEYYYYGKDKDENLMPSSKDVFISLPSIYRPFYFNSLFFIDSGGTSVVDLAIFNGITYMGKFKSVKCTVCNHPEYDFTSEISSATTVNEVSMSENILSFDSGKTVIPFSFGYCHPYDGNSFKNDLSVGYFLKDTGTHVPINTYAFDYRNNKNGDDREGYRTYGRKWYVEGATDGYYKDNKGKLTFEFSVTEGCSDDYIGNTDINTISESFQDIQFPYYDSDTKTVMPINSNIVFVSTKKKKAYGSFQKLESSYYDYGLNKDNIGNKQFRGLYSLYEPNVDSIFKFNELIIYYYSLLNGGNSESDAIDTAIKTYIPPQDYGDDGDDGAVYAVYDSYVVETGGYDFIKGDDTDPNPYVSNTRHTNIMSIVKEYKREDFVKLITKYLQ